MSDRLKLVLPYGIFNFFFILNYRNASVIFINCVKSCDIIWLALLFTNVLGLFHLFSWGVPLLQQNINENTYFKAIDTFPRGGAEKGEKFFLNLFSSLNLSKACLHFCVYISQTACTCLFIPVVETSARLNVCSKMWLLFVFFFISFCFSPQVLTPKVIGVAIARYDFSSRDTRELSLQEGDVVKIYTKSGANGWWRGEVNGRVSVAPATLIDKPEEKKIGLRERSCWVFWGFFLYPAFGALNWSP